eukprot:592197-Rhodomonas_salina.1
MGLCTCVCVREERTSSMRRLAARARGVPSRAAPAAPRRAGGGSVLHASPTPSRPPRSRSPPFQPHPN